jgi:hypothetical protein
VQETLEDRIVDHLRRGELLDLAPGEDIDEEVMMRWNEGHNVDAGLVRDLLLDRRRAEPDPRGLRIRGARIHGRLDLDDVTTATPLVLLECLILEGASAIGAHLRRLTFASCLLRRQGGSPLNAQMLRVDGILDLSKSRIESDTIAAAVHLGGGSVGGNFVVSGAQLRNDSGPALQADRLQVEGSLLLTRGFTAAGAGDNGAVRLSDGKINGHLVCRGAHVRNQRGPALAADFLRVDGSVFLDAFDAVGNGEDGAVQLSAAEVRGQLVCTAAQLRNDSGAALTAHGLRVGSDMFIDASFNAVGAGDNGAVRLSAAEIGGQFVCVGAHLRNDSGPALRAERLQIDGDALLTDGFTAAGNGNDGAVHLSDGKISGGLALHRAELYNRSGPALDTEGLQVGHDMQLDWGLTVARTDEISEVRLYDTKITGQLVCSRETVNERFDHVRWGLDGLTYSGIPAGVGLQDWLALFQDRMPTYAAQPYQQLAAAHRAAGHDREVRQILIAQRKDQLNRAVPGRAEKAWGRLTGVTLGYGYQPWRALAFLLAIVATAVGISIWLGGQGALAHTARGGSAGSPCSTVEQAAVGLDLGLPLIKTGARDRCDISTAAKELTVFGWTVDRPPGEALLVAGAVLQLLAWGFATLFVAGFTGAVRKT